MANRAFLTIADCESETRRIHLNMTLIYHSPLRKATLSVSIRICPAQLAGVKFDILPSLPDVPLPCRYSPLKTPEPTR
jgi:hypothetical protein